MTTLEIVLLVATISMFVGYVHATFKLWKSIELTNMMIRDYIVLREYLEQGEIVEEKDEQTVHTENFIKFLSDSREWAFDYIENSMKEVKGILALIESRPGDPGILDGIKSRLETLIDNERKKDE